jgi:mRNA export factor
MQQQQPTTVALSSNPNNDVVVPNSPLDTVSALLFSPTSNYLLSASWTKELAIYDVQSNGTAALKGKLAHSHPMLCVDWNADGGSVLSGGSDGQARVWNLATNQEVTIGQHAAPIKSIHFVKEMNVAITGSFDKTIKYW